MKLLPASYAKLNDGTWGLRIVGSTARFPVAVEVTKRDGKKQKEVVGKILWRGDGVALASIAK